MRILYELVYKPFGCRESATLKLVAPFYCNMNEPTRGSFDVNNVEGIENLKDRLAKADNDRDLSKILADYISWGNNKISKNTAIFNMNSATDCPNADTSPDNQSNTGMCQVPWKSCYAHKAEYIYNDALPYRRRQEYLWDSLSAEEWAGAFKEIVSRKRNPVKFIRFSEAGDFRHTGDIEKVNRVAKYLIPDGIGVYTYSASHKLDWSNATHFTVNQSNELADYGDRLFSAVETTKDIPDNAIMCPFEAASKNGIKTDSRPKCGECTHCIKPQTEQSRDVYITLH